jgi:drug/metabolite transporter (DMT)-like permease
MQSILPARIDLSTYRHYNSVMKTSTAPIAPIIPLIVGMIAISFAPILVRYSHAPVSVQAMYRMLFTILIMLPFGVKQLPQLRSIKKQDWKLLGLAGFFLALHFLLWMESLNYTSIASSTIILTLEPIFVMIGAFFIFKDRIGTLALIGLIVALIGAICVGSGDISLSLKAFTGDLLSLISMLAMVVNLLFAKRILTRISSYLYSMIVFTIAFVCFAGYNLVMNFSFTGYPANEWTIFVLLAIIPTVLGHMIFNWLLQYLKPTTISISVLAEPVGSSLLGMMIFKEMVTSFQYIGGAFIILGLLIYMKTENTDKPIAEAM